MNPTRTKRGLEAKPKSKKLALETQLIAFLVFKYTEKQSTGRNTAYKVSASMNILSWSLKLPRNDNVGKKALHENESAQPQATFPNRSANITLLKYLQKLDSLIEVLLLIFCIL